MKLRKLKTRQSGKKAHKKRICDNDGNNPVVMNEKSEKISELLIFTMNNIQTYFFIIQLRI